MTTLHGAAHVLHGRFQFSQIKDFTLVILFSNKTKKSDYYAEHRLSYFPL